MNTEKNFDFMANKDALMAELTKIADETAAKISYEDKEFEAKLKSMFKACFLNTVETTATCFEDRDVFVITGDIEAMWLRDSSAQVVHYLPFADKCPEVARFIRSLIRRQMTCIITDPYSNAFIENKNCKSEWLSDKTDMSPLSWERKYEIDSLCYPVWLIENYYEKTKDTTLFDDEMKKVFETILTVFETELKHREQSKYTFERFDCVPTDTLKEEGKGTPVAYTGMTWSGFRPSDDACTYGYLIPSNLFAVRILGYIVDFAKELYKDAALAKRAEDLKNTIADGIAKYAIYKHPDFGNMYAYETDGMGNYNLMDDANVPSLLSLPWLKVCDAEDPVYKATRKFVLSEQNPYYYEGKACRGIGSPHTPKRYVWHIALTMQGLTSTSREEQEELLKTLVSTDAGTGFMHEGFNCDNPDEFTRSWFAWANSLFASFVLKLV